MLLDSRPLPLPTVFIGSGIGACAPLIEEVDATTGALNLSVNVYNARFLGGVRVATGDFTGDGFPDVVVAPGAAVAHGAGHGPRIEVLDGKTGAVIDGPLGSFLAFAPSVRGVFVAAADVNGDGRTDVIAVAETASGAMVRVFSGVDGKILSQFEVPGAAFASGLTVAAADLTGDGKADVVVGSGSTSRVRVYDAMSGTLIAGPLGSFDAFGKSYRGGVYVNTDARRRRGWRWYAGYRGGNGIGLARGARVQRCDRRGALRPPAVWEGCHGRGTGGVGICG